MSLNLVIIHLIKLIWTILFLQIWCSLFLTHKNGYNLIYINKLYLKT